MIYVSQFIGVRTWFPINYKSTNLKSQKNKTHNCAGIRGLRSFNEKRRPNA